MTPEFSPDSENTADLKETTQLSSLHSSGYRASSYQQSRYSSSGSKKSHRESILEFFNFVVVEAMQRFSIDGGYESAPTDDDDFEDENGVEVDTLQQGSKKRRFTMTKLLIVGTLVVSVGAIFFVAFRRFVLHQHPAFQYTGEPPVCDSHDGPSLHSLQGTKSFALLENIEHGAVAADHPKCSEIGLSILRDYGGNAVDAAVATTLCLGVANPSSSGIGGGAFILIHADEGHHNDRKMPKFHDARNQSSHFPVADSGKITEVIDCREVAGEAASTYMYEAGEIPSDATLFGGLAVAVPGELRGLELAHARHGVLEWAAVVRPAMELARDGVPVNNHLALAIQLISTQQQSHGGLPSLRKLLTHNDDWKHLLREGDLLKNPKLAETLKAVMEEGADAIYTGKRADQLAREIVSAGGILTRDDLEQFYPTLRSPVISDNVFGFHVVGVPPPSSGGAVIIGALRFLKGYALPLATYADTLSIHRMVEALKHVFAIRMSLADPAFVIGNNVTNATTQDAVDALIEGPYMEELRRSSRDDALLNLSQYGGAMFAQLRDSDGQEAPKNAKEGDRRRRKLIERPLQQGRRLFNQFGYLEDHGTSHLSVVDKDGNAVAITTSVNGYFGSCIVSESTGIVLNNQMDDFGNPGKANAFGLKPSEANFISPGKKPLSSMSPTMVFQAKSTSDENTETRALGDLRMVLGASGGPKIITAVFQVIVNYLLLGMPLFDSVAHPRIHNQLIYRGAAATCLENSVIHPSEINILVSNRSRTALTKRDQLLVDMDYAGTVQAVAVDPETGFMTAVCDIRKGGSPVGY